jgi:hypothetical protein
VDELETATEDDQPGDDYDDPPGGRAKGSAIARNPKAMSRIAQTIDFPELSVESAAVAIVSSLLFPSYLSDLVCDYLFHELKAAWNRFAAPSQMPGFTPLPG